MGLERGEVRLGSRPSDQGLDQEVRVEMNHRTGLSAPFAQEVLPRCGLLPCQMETALQLPERLERRYSLDARGGGPGLGDRSAGGRLPGRPPGFRQLFQRSRGVFVDFQERVFLPHGARILPVDRPPQGRSLQRAACPSVDPEGSI
jgi:hypothetical protein